MKKEELTAQYVLDILLLVVFMVMMVYRTERQEERRKTWSPSILCLPLLILRYLLPHHDWVEDHCRHQDEMVAHHIHHHRHLPHHDENYEPFSPDGKEDDIFAE
jgi:hypothetical protein